MMLWDDGHWSGWDIALMWMAMIVFWGLLIGGVYAIVRAGRGRASHDHPHDNAHHHLDERLARGEIDPDEYRHLLDVLAAGRQRRVEDASRR
jgi:putative membrane protein